MAKTEDRLVVIDALVNTWLKDRSIYCNNCDMPYIKGNPVCCEDPQIGTNYQHTTALIIENDLRRQNLGRDDGATPGQHMRIALSMPPRLYQFIRNYFEKYATMMEDPSLKFPKDNHELHQLMRRFPKLCIAKTI